MEVTARRSFGGEKEALWGFAAFECQTFVFSVNVLFRLAFGNPAADAPPTVATRPPHVRALANARSLARPLACLL